MGERLYINLHQDQDAIGSQISSIFSSREYDSIALMQVRWGAGGVGGGNQGAEKKHRWEERTIGSGVSPKHCALGSLLCSAQPKSCRQPEPLSALTGDHSQAEGGTLSLLTWSQPSLEARGEAAGPEQARCQGNVGHG